jgi:hypothetical protein
MLELRDNFSRQKIIDNFLTIFYMTVKSEILDFVLLRQLRACTNTYKYLKNTKDRKNET